MTVFMNRHDELEKRRRLRREAPEAEVLLWQQLRGNRLAGYKFRRQVGAGPFVLDFYCPSRKLAIEVDGPTHNGDEAQIYDTVRRRKIEAMGIQFLRITNAAVYNSMSDVLLQIERTLSETVLG